MSAPGHQVDCQRAPSNCGGIVLVFRLMLPKQELFYRNCVLGGDAQQNRAIWINTLVVSLKTP